MLWSLFLLLISHRFVNGHSSNNPEIIRQSRPLSTSNFDQIKIFGTFDVLLSQLTSPKDIADAQNSAAVEIDTTAEAQKQISVEIKDNQILTITVVGSINVREKPRMFIRMIKPITSYEVFGNGSTTTDANGLKNRVNAELRLFQEGQATFDLKLDVSSLRLLVYRTAQIRLRGQVYGTISFFIMNDAQVDALNLISREVSVLTMAGGSLKTQATESIQIYQPGPTAEIYYKLPKGKTPDIYSPSPKTKIVAL